MLRLESPVETTDLYSSQLLDGDRAECGFDMAIEPALPQETLPASRRLSANDVTDDRHIDLLSGNAAVNGVPVW